MACYDSFAPHLSSSPSGHQEQQRSVDFPLEHQRQRRISLVDTQIAGLSWITFSMLKREALYCFWKNRNLRTSVVWTELAALLINLIM